MVNKLLPHSIVYKLKDQTVPVPPVYTTYIPVYPKAVLLYPFPMHALQIEFIKLANVGTDIRLQLVCLLKF